MYRTELQVYNKCTAALAEEKFKEGLKALTIESLRRPDPAVASDFYLKFSFGIEGMRSGYSPAIHFDDRYSFVLMYDALADEKKTSLALAVASFHIRGCRPSLLIPPYRLFITQLQGVRHSSVYIPPEHLEIRKKATRLISWPVFLTRSAILLAQTLADIEQVWIKKACDNGYYRPEYARSTDLDKVHNGRLEDRYDRTAAQCGFVTNDLAHVFTIKGPSSA